MNVGSNKQYSRLYYLRWMLTVINSIEYCINRLNYELSLLSLSFCSNYNNFGDALDKLAGCTVSFLRIQLYNLLPHPWHHKTALKYPSNFFSPFGGCGTCLVPNFWSPFQFLRYFFKCFQNFHFLTPLTPLFWNLLLRMSQKASNFFFSFWGVWHMFSIQFLKPFLVLEVFFQNFHFLTPLTPLFWNLLLRPSQKP